jgi:hypothetical protein
VTNSNEFQGFIEEGWSEPVPESLSFFLMAHADHHQVHFGNLMFWCLAIFTVMGVWATQIDSLKLLN